MKLNEAISLIARETGWTLEYIRSLPVGYFQVLVYEFTFEKSLEIYRDAYNAAMIVCALINSKSHHYKPEDIIGHLPERRDMENPKLGQLPKVDTITLADGKEYQLAPLNINMLVDMEDKLNKSMDELFTPPVHAKVLRAMLFARVKPGCPNMTEDQLGELITDVVLLNIGNKLGV
jgi:hypothetical protein